MKFVTGQRWFSQTEPELGLGLIEGTDQRRIRVRFPAVNEKRVYADQRAPLQRYELKVGQWLTADDGLSGEITDIERSNDVLIYHLKDDSGAPQIIPEMLLAHELRLDAADKRLLSGQVNHLHWYQLRHRLREQYADYQAQPIRGFLGGRIQLTPHQYYVAQAATANGMPRVLLSDEVGLGKTIEAGLILHRLETQGRASRSLIVVPDHLLHQWLVEMIRKFDMPFSVFDQSRLEAIAEDTPDTNPFDTEQRVLVAASLWENHPEALDQALATHWDVLVVDEAHHLETNANRPNSAFSAIQRLSEVIPGVLLLTATPEQDGSASHFSRLQMLDPAYFNDFAAWQEQESRLGELSDALAAFTAQGHREDLDAWCQDEYSQSLLDQALNADDEANIQQLVDYLIDVHGTGRHQFRNTRDRIKGFPERRVHAHELPCPVDYPQDLPYPETAVVAWTESDPRVYWLADLIRQTEGKVLVICHHKSTARGLEGHLRLREGLATAQFHEDMDLVERDRAAAWFADAEDGADALICSEIGSEGRNFQFAHTLVCFDLPPHPDLLEQRIGRLDRIGQTNTVHIHVPCLEDHLISHWFRWYHDGLDAFEHTSSVGEAVLQHALPDATAPHSLLDLPTDDPVAFDAQVELAWTLSEQLSEAQKAGKNRLLEWHSFNREAADTLLSQIAEFESRLSPESIVIEALDSFGIEVESEGQGLFSVRPGEKMIPDSFPFMSDDGGLITFRRNIAVSRDDVRFITWEHPLVEFILETMDNTHLGAAGVTLISLPSLPQGSLFLEASFLPLMQHSQRIQASRFLPQSLFTCVVDQNGQDVSHAFRGIDWRDLEKRLEKNTLLEIIKTQQTLIQQLVAQVRNLAQPAFADTVSAADAAADAFYQGELARLTVQRDRTGQDLSPLLAMTEHEANAVRGAIGSAELHLDNLRLIVNF